MPWPVDWPLPLPDCAEVLDKRFQNLRDKLNVSIHSNWEQAIFRHSSFSSPQGARSVSLHNRRLHTSAPRGGHRFHQIVREIVTLGKSHHYGRNTRSLIPMLTLLGLFRLSPNIEKVTKRRCASRTPCGSQPKVHHPIQSPHTSRFINSTLVPEDKLTTSGLAVFRMGRGALQARLAPLRKSPGGAGRVAGPAKSPYSRGVPTTSTPLVPKGLNTTTFDSKMGGGQYTRTGYAGNPPNAQERYYDEISLRVSSPGSKEMDRGLQASVS